MKKHTKAFLELGLFYIAIVVLLDFFLTDYPILVWLALGVSFLFFIGLVFDMMLQLTSTRRFDKPILGKSPEDELQRLERLTMNAIENGDPDAVSNLSKRMGALLLKASSFKTNHSETQLDLVEEQDPWAISGEIKGDQLTVASKLHSSDREERITEIERLLAKLESWSF